MHTSFNHSLRTRLVVSTQHLNTPPTTTCLRRHNRKQTRTGILNKPHMKGERNWQTYKTSVCTPVGRLVPVPAPHHPPEATTRHTQEEALEFRETERREDILERKVRPCWMSPEPSSCWPHTMIQCSGCQLAFGLQSAEVKLLEKAFVPGWAGVLCCLPWLPEMGEGRPENSGNFQKQLWVCE